MAVSRANAGSKREREREGEKLWYARRWWQQQRCVCAATRRRASSLLKREGGRGRQRQEGARDLRSKPRLLRLESGSKDDTGGTRGKERKRSDLIERRESGRGDAAGGRGRGAERCEGLAEQKPTVVEQSRRRPCALPSFFSPDADALLMSKCRKGAPRAGEREASESGRRERVRGRTDHHGRR